MTSEEEVALANNKDAFMRLMAARPRPRRLREIYKIYQSHRWPGVHGELVKMVRAAERERNKEESDQLARALGDVFRYQIKGYKLGRCGYVPADLPQGAKSDEIEEYQRRGFFPSREATVLDPTTATWFGHHFLSSSAERVPEWCPEHTGAARVRTHRQKNQKRVRHSTVPTKTIHKPLPPEVVERVRRDQRIR